MLATKLEDDSRHTAAIACTHRAVMGTGGDHALQQLVLQLRR